MNLRIHQRYLSVLLIVSLVKSSYSILFCMYKILLLFVNPSYKKASKRAFYNLKAWKIIQKYKVVLSDTSLTVLCDSQYQMF